MRSVMVVKLPTLIFPRSWSTAAPDTVGSTSTTSRAPSISAKILMFLGIVRTPTNVARHQIPRESGGGGGSGKFSGIYGARQWDSKNNLNGLFGGCW